MKSSSNVAVVGSGYWGSNFVRIFHGLPSCDLRAVCDRSQDRLVHINSLYPDVRLTRNATDVFESPDIDAVVIATPARSHFELAKESLLNGKHTLVEKPLAASAAECRELIELARTKNLILMVGHTYRYSAAVRKIRELVTQGELGSIRYINARRLNLGLFQNDINVAWDLAPHDISIVTYLLGESPSLVNCQGNAHLTSGVEDVSNLSLTFPRKRFASIQSSWIEPRKVREMTIVGTKRMIVYNDVEPLEKLRIYDLRVEKPAHYETFAEFMYSYHYGDSYVPRLEQEEPLKVEARHFLDCVATGSPVLTPGEDGLHVVEILEAASRSLARNGAPVAFRRSSDYSLRDIITDAAA